MVREVRIGIFRDGSLGMASLRTLRWACLLGALVAASPAWGQIEVAEELFVSLDANDPSAGEDFWENAGSLADFARVGNPTLVEIEGVAAVIFNEFGLVGDAYQCLDPAPAGLTGLDPTRSIEVWAYNPDIVAEETLVAWGGRGGPDGSNISFNYGNHATWGAVGHWGWPDIGWNDAGGAPEAGKWHHLAYTYDGTTTRVYADGVQWNEEILGAGVISTHPDTPIVLAAQWVDAVGTALNPDQGGTLAIARVRVHDGVLTPEQIGANFDAERGDFGIDFEAPVWGAPPQGEFYLPGERTYTVPLQPPTGLPLPSVEAIAPAGAAIDANHFVTYTIPAPEPASFVVTVRATNEGGSADLSWTVTRQTLPPAGQIARAGTLLVDLDAADASAGDAFWENAGTLGDFERLGLPLLEDIGGLLAVTFNGGGLAVGDAYRCVDPAPAGIVGRNPTRSIEVWAYNPEIAAEETLVAWGMRGGPCGSNMSFNYGSDIYFGAAGQWCHLPIGPASPDIGWDNGGAVPSAAAWHHLAYTFDGTTTRVYADGQLWNEDVLGPNVISTHPGTAILLAAQWENATTPNIGFGGTLSLARVRVHDGVLRPSQILHNFETEREEFLQAPTFPDAPAEDFVLEGESYTRKLTVVGNPTPVLAVASPAGGTISSEGIFTYAVPAPAPDSFVVRITATNGEGSAEASWTVTVVKQTPLASGPLHRYSFEADASDSIEGADGVVYGNVVFADGKADFQNAGTENSNANGQSPPGAPPGGYIDLPNGIVSQLGSQATFEAWFTWRGPSTAYWQRIFDFGTADAGEDWSSGAANSRYIFLTTHSGGETTRFGYRQITPAIEERWIESAVTPLDEEQHVVITWNDDTTTVRMYVNALLVDQDTAKHLTLAEIPDVSNWLGRSIWADAMFNGTIDEFRIYERELTYGEVIGNFRAGPDVVNTGGGPGKPIFRRGDADAVDGVVNITDAIFILNYLFQGGGEPPCLDAADADNEFAINITDGIYVLSFLFLGGPEPPAPGPYDCGPEPEPDPLEPTPLDCKSYPPGC